MYYGLGKMKFNTGIFICLVFSTICIIKAEPSDEVGEEAEQSCECNAAQTFQYKPSERLKELERQLPADKKDFVPEGKVRETITKVYQNAMKKGVAKEGREKLNEEWTSMFKGSEASRVIGTCGRNFGKVVSSDEGAEILNTVWTTAHLLLSKAGKETRGAGLGRIMSSMYKLFKTSEMPEIVSLVGGLIISVAEKENAVQFVKQAFKEVQNMLNDKKLAEKINTYFKNMVSMMKNLKVPKTLKSSPSLKRARTVR